jgi:hypothetical protein
MGAITDGTVASGDATRDEIAEAIRQATVGLMAAIIHAARLDMAQAKGPSWSAPPLEDTAREAYELYRATRAGEHVQGTAGQRGRQALPVLGPSQPNGCG